MQGQIVPNLWFDGNALEAATFYSSLFPGGQVLATSGSTPDGHPVTVEWQMRGQHFVGINGGPGRPFTEAVSFAITCDDQAEVDRFWEALTADGGEEVQCGWLRDRFGLSWQIIPAELIRLLGDADPERAAAATQAMLTMRKIDIAAIRAAADAAG